MNRRESMNQGLSDSMRPTLSPASLVAPHLAAPLPFVTSGLVVLLYVSLMLLVTEAHEALDTKEIGRARDRICHAQAAIDELIATVEPKAAPQLSHNLLILYQFCRRRLFDATMDLDPNALEDVMCAIAPLIDAWALPA